MKCVLVLCFVFTGNVTFAEDTWVTMNLRGHGNVVQPYLDALIARSELASQKTSRQLSAAPQFNEYRAREVAAGLHPLRPLNRGEFETKESFQKRVEASSDYNAAASRKQAQTVKEMRRKFAEAVEVFHNNAKKAAAKNNYIRQRPEHLKSQHHNVLYVAYPANALRYDIDTKRFPALRLPSPSLGESAYGYAEMNLRFSPREFGCDVVAAKKIRQVSEKGELFVILKLTDARLRIIKGQKEINRTDGEVLQAKTGQFAAGLAILALSEYFQPGSAQEMPGVLSIEVDQTKMVPQITVDISAQSIVYHQLYDAGAKQFFHSIKDEVEDVKPDEVDDIKLEIIEDIKLEERPRPRRFPGPSTATQR